MSPDILLDLQAKTAKTKSIASSGDLDLINTLTREDILGDVFYASILSYYSQLNDLANIFGKIIKGQHYLAAGYGSSGYEPGVDYLFGLPRDIKLGGVAMNMPMIRILGIDDNDKSALPEYNYQVGLISSTLEHAIPEQMFTSDPLDPPEAISAVKALKKAFLSGQKIYHITQKNSLTVIPSLHLNDATISEITNALKSGMEVITHTDQVSVPGWTGDGYILLDPVTGNGAYKITGGSNGMFIKTRNERTMGIESITESHISARMFAKCLKSPSLTLEQAIIITVAVAVFVAIISTGAIPAAVAALAFIFATMASAQASASTLDGCTCTPDEHDQLQAEVEKWCGMPHACLNTDDFPTLSLKANTAIACSEARRDINNFCFGGGDVGHKIAQENAEKAYNTCINIMLSK